MFHCRIFGGLLGAAALLGCGAMGPKPNEDATEHPYRHLIYCQASRCHQEARDVCFRHHSTYDYDVIGQPSGRTGLVVDCRP